MAGGIILSNRLRAMQEAAENFGTSITGIRAAQRKAQLEDEDRRIAAEDRVGAQKEQALRLRTLGNQADLSDITFGQAKAQDAARKEAQGLAGQIENFGQAVPDSAIGMPEGLPGMQSMRPVADTTGEEYKDRLRASFMNADARSKGENAAFTKADVQRQRAEAAAKKQNESKEFSLGLKKTEADIENTKAGTARQAMETAKLKKEIESIGKGGMDPEKAVAVEGKLRTEFVNQNKVFMDVRDAWSRVNASGDDAAGDLSLIFNYMKMLDPGSTVREGEFATAQDAAGVPERVMNAYNNALKGTRLNPAQRNQFKGQAGKLYDSQKDIYANNAKTYLTLAADYGVNPGRVVVDLEGGVKSAPQAPAAGQAVAVSTREQRDALPPGTAYIGPDGKRAVKR